jgi:small conductance mechanosensitive channel
MELLNAAQDFITQKSALGVSLRIVLILAAAILITRADRYLTNWLAKRAVRLWQQTGTYPGEGLKRASTLYGLVEHAFDIVIWIVAISVVLLQLGVDIGHVLAGAGIAGIGVGLGAQHMIGDWIAGISLVSENQVRVGDAARINGTLGIVERILFRTITIRDLSGEVHHFRHGLITSLSNLSDQWSAYVFEIGVSYKENVDTVMALITQVAGELSSDQDLEEMILEDVEIFGVDRFAESAIVIKGRIKTHPRCQWQVGREFLRRIKLAFDDNNIEIPFPHRTIYLEDDTKKHVVEEQK